MFNKKSVRNIAKAMSVTLGACAIASSLTACGKDANKLSNESTPLVLATDVLDGVFNPFFYTSGSDGEVVGQTQIGMLSSDKDGQLVAGWDEPCVSLDYSFKTTGTAPNGNDYSNYYTEYYFALKDNIKFSDGTLLTKDDVLFNMYMYLDPAYTGSSTMYSVKIKGLQDYRTQTINASSSAASSAEKLYNSEAEARINKIKEWADTSRNPNTLWSDLANYEYHASERTIEKDIEQAHAFFREELNSDFNSALALDVEKEYEKYKKADGSPCITTCEQAFLYMYGIYKLNPKYGNDNKIAYYEIDNDYKSTDYSQEALVNYVFAAKLGDLDTVKRATTASSIKSYKENLVSVITYYATANELFNYVKSSIMSLSFKGNMKVFNVDGIEIIHQNTIPDKTGEDIKLLDQNGNQKDYDILKITIDGVDPKAIQNFGFTVAPGHYYAGAANWAKRNTTAENAEDLFFGVPFADPDFMRSVKENHIPLGAGPYRAATESGGTPTADRDFFKDNLVFMASNENFLLGAPKIKKLTFKVVSSNMLYDAVQKKEVYYASPSIDKEKLPILSASKDLNYASADNLGYGYIGVSALYIPNIYIRRAIMTTLNAQDCVDYYGGGDNASVIRRPMSKTLVDYYPTEATDRYPFDKTGASAKQLLEEGGCKPVGDKYVDENGNPLKYTFTIAGDSDDHPAASMLLHSAEILNSIGLDVTVVHDSTALSKLANGQLTVWAAAWSSSSDPDMYQVYHKDSSATSTLAWGYRYLKSAECLESDRTKPVKQSQILEELSVLIEQGREYTEVKDRKPIYEKALDKLMDLAVEFPTYQRKVYYVWPSGIFDETTMEKDVTSYQSPLNKIWELSFNEG